MKLSDFLVPIDTYSTQYIDAAFFERDLSLNAIWAKFDNVDSSIISLNNEIIILNASIGDIGTALTAILG